jgi:tripartite-type tricarboxylate transporter receptor subunit TctC
MKPDADVCRRALLLLTLFTLHAATAGWAADSDVAAYPERSIRLVVPFPPGASPNDITGRLIGRHMTESIGQQVVVDNRAGAGGTIGADVVAKANPDGYTMLVTSTTLTISPNVYRKLPYEVARDLQPVTLIASAPMLVFVNTAVTANTLQELIAHIKTRPGQFNFSSGGTGTVPHFAGELLNFMAKIRMVHVPYKGGAPAAAAMISGEVSMFIDTPTAMTQFVKQGKIKALGVAAKERFALMPDVPTMAEAGLPGYEINVWYGFFVPAKTPRAIVDKLHNHTTRALGTDDVKARLAAIGTQPAGNGPDEFRAIVQAELQKWAKVAQESGIKPE